ncbi:alpha/beta hydrolase [Pendulispora brunnea]|uniref:Alpha/beta hydrolase n=1 Tax=Pendulispora brunnea TaxID=2905690 RepID=A0ABZ2JY25_9BACT
MHSNRPIRLIARTLLLSATLFATACSQPKSPEPGVQTEPPENPLAVGQHTTMIGGYPIAYHVHGSGPVVFAHPGGPGGGWSYLRMPEVEKFATVVYIEPIGTGASGRLPDPANYSRSLDVANVDGLRAHLGMQKITLLGHSYGGFVALTYALTYPDHVGALVLYDTSAMTGPDFGKDVAANMEWFKNEPWFADASKAFDDIDTARTDQELTAFVKRAVPFYIGHWTERHEALEGKLPPLEFFVERSHRQKANVPQVRVVKGGQPYDVRPRLGEIKVPTLIIVGEKDFICSAKMADILHQGISSSRLTVLAGIGHLGHVETPQEYARPVREFLAQLGK